MYTVLSLSHNYLRWILLLSLAITLVKYLISWSGNQPWRKIDNTLGIVFTSLMDVQLLIGLVLYFFVSPITKIAFSEFGAAMKDADFRFYAVELIAMMLIAVILVHIGRAKSKKARADHNKFKTATLFYLAALVFILVAIPWDKI